MAPLTSSAALAIIGNTSVFDYSFSVPGTLAEAGSAGESWSGYWWVNSGAYMHLADGTGMTNQGTLDAGNKWRTTYANANPTDTDNGTHPQNIFRLVSRQTWANVQEKAYFKINKDNLSASPNRDAHNGLLLMSRYGNSGQTLYYAGVRVDGKAIIKKKLNGTYTTLASKTVFSGAYNRSNNPNLLPKDTWIGLRSETINNSDGSVTIKLYMDKGKTGKWTLVAEAKDTSPSTLRNAGYGGIRTDFMDVEFDNFSATKL